MFSVSSLLFNVINHALGARISLLKQFKLDSLRLPRFTGLSRKKVINVYAMEIKSILKHKNKYADKKLHSSLLPQSFVCLATSAVLVAIVMCTHRPTLGQTAAAAAHSPTNPQLHWIIPHRNVRSQVAR